MSAWPGNRERLSVGRGIYPFLLRALIEHHLYVRPWETAREKPWVLGDRGGSWGWIKAGDGKAGARTAASTQEMGK